jgi:hypothetical protein
LVEIDLPLSTSSSTNGRERVQIAQDSGNDDP